MQKYIIATFLITALFIVTFNGATTQIFAAETAKAKDQKYVCSEGQFAGFVVDSPEVCNLEIQAPPVQDGPEVICEKCINFYLHYSGDERRIDPVLNPIRSALNLPIQQNCCVENANLTQGAHSIEIAAAIKELLFDENDDIKGNAQELFDQFVTDVRDVGFGTERNIIAMGNAIIKCLADRFGLTVPTAELIQTVGEQKSLFKLFDMANN